MFSAQTVWLRAQVTPAKRGKGSRTQTTDEAPARPPDACRAAMTCTQRLKRVFNIDVAKSAGQPTGTAAGCREAIGYRDLPDETCRASGGALKVIAFIEDPIVIEKILGQLNEKATLAGTHLLPESRIPPLAGLFE